MGMEVSVSGIRKTTFRTLLCLARNDLCPAELVELLHRWRWRKLGITSLTLS